MAKVAHIAEKVDYIQRDFDQVETGPCLLLELRASFLCFSLALYLILQVLGKREANTFFISSQHDSY